MKNLLKFSMVTEFLMGFILIILGIGFLKDILYPSGFLRFLPEFNSDILNILLFSYAAILITSLVAKNIFWYRYQKQYNLIDLPIEWFFVIPITSTFLPSRFLSGYINENRRNLWGFYILTIIYYTAPFILIADALSTQILIHLLFIFSFIFESDLGPMLVFLLYALTHFAHYYFYGIVKNDMEKPPPDAAIEMIGKG